MDYDNLDQRACNCDGRVRVGGRPARFAMSRSVRCIGRGHHVHLANAMTLLARWPSSPARPAASARRWPCAFTGRATAWRWWPAAPLRSKRWASHASKPGALSATKFTSADVAVTDSIVAAGLACIARVKACRRGDRQCRHQRRHRHGHPRRHRPCMARTWPPTTSAHGGHLPSRLPHAMTRSEAAARWSGSAAWPASVACPAMAPIAPARRP